MLSFTSKRYRGPLCPNGGGLGATIWRSDATAELKGSIVRAVLKENPIAPPTRGGDVPSSSPDRPGLCLNWLSPAGTTRSSSVALEESPTDKSRSRSLVRPPPRCVKGPDRGATLQSSSARRCTACGCSIARFASRFFRRRKQRAGSSDWPRTSCCGWVSHGGTQHEDISPRLERKRTCVHAPQKHAHHSDALSSWTVAPRAKVSQTGCTCTACVQRRCKMRDASKDCCRPTTSRTTRGSGRMHDGTAARRMLVGASHGEIDDPSAETDRQGQPGHWAWSEWWQ